MDALALNGCDTDDSSDSQYASVASPASHPRHGQHYPASQHNYYTTHRLQPSRQSQPHRNPYISPQLSRLTSTLRASGYNPMETCSNSSACSSPQRTALTNLSSSSTTVSSAQLGSPHLFRYHTEAGAEAASLGHVYCEIPASSRTGHYDNVRWPTQQPRGRFRQPARPPPKYCRETDEEEAATYGEDTACDLQNVSDLSDDETHRDFWIGGDAGFPFPPSAPSAAREAKSPKTKRSKRSDDNKLCQRGPGVSARQNLRPEA
jgi:hypothetical protein